MRLKWILVFLTCVPMEPLAHRHPTTEITVALVPWDGPGATVTRTSTSAQTSLADTDLLVSTLRDLTLVNAEPDLRDEIAS